MRKVNPRPVGSFLEDDFDLSSIKRRKKPIEKLHSAPPKESKLPDLIKTVLPEAVPPVEAVKEKKRVKKAKIPTINNERPVLKADRRGGFFQTAGIFCIRWLIMPAIAVAMCLLLYATIDGVIEDLRDDRIRANSGTYSQIITSQVIW